MLYGALSQKIFRGIACGTQKDHEAAGYQLAGSNQRTGNTTEGSGKVHSCGDRSCLLPWSDFIKEHCSGLIDTETITVEDHPALPV